MSGFLSDDAVVERILGHLDAGTTDRGDTVWREPVASYTSQERLALERERVLLPALTPFCPGAALPERGSFQAREVLGVPVVVVRGRDGRVRAFRNVCRHRGARLAQGAGCAHAFVCPYHGWTYGLDGALRNVTHPEGFPGLDPGAHGLAPLLAEERLGLVFVSLGARAQRALGSDALPTLVAPEQELLGQSEAVVEANWKVYLEGFLEGYHIRFAHPESFYPFGYDNLTLVEHCGAHTRVTFPFRRIEKLRGAPRGARPVDGRLTYVYHLFPNALVTVLSRHTNLLLLEPLDPGRTRVVSYQLTNRGADAHEAGLARRDSGFVGSTGAAEDLALVTSVQRGLASGANQAFTFGRDESALAHFHATLGSALARRPESCGAPGS